MNGCPNDAQLQAILAGRLALEDAGRLDEHLAACGHCQTRLGTLLHDPQWDRWQTAWVEAHMDSGRSNETGPDETDRTADDRGVRPLPTGAGTAEEDASATADTEDPHRAVERDPLHDATLTMDEAHVARRLLEQLGPFRDLEEIGRGSFGVVFRGTSTLHPRVALKILTPSRAADPQEIARFEREGPAAAAVQHENVVRIYQAGTTGTPRLPYLVMELIDGESLWTRLKREHRIAPRAAAEIVRQAALGLHAAHRCGLVHRDVKPSNILLTQASGQVKMTDFGLVFVPADDVSQASGLAAAAGTPHYMSPEQIREPKRVDGRSDVYGLGVVLFEMLTGERPFRGVGHDLLMQIVHDEPPAPRALDSSLPRDLDTIVQRCLAKQPALRFADAQAVADDLGRFLASEPIRARPVSRPRRAWLWCRRKPWRAGFLALACLASLMLVTGLSVAWQREHGLRQGAEQERTRATQSYRQQLETLEFMADRLIQELPVEPGTSEIRRRLEQDFLRHFREVVDKSPETNSVYYADACAQYAYYAQAFGRLEEAGRYYERAVAVYDALPGTERVRALDDQAKCRVNLSNVYPALGRHAEAGAQLTQALALWQQLNREEPGGGRQLEIGTVFLQRGHVNAQSGKRREALQDYEQAEQQFRALLARSPDDASLLGSLAGLKRNMGNAWYDLAKKENVGEGFARARECYLEAVETARRITGEFAQSKEHLNELAEHFNTLAVAEKELASFDAARSAYDQSLKIRRGLVQSYPGDVAVREGLARSLNNLANLHLARNEHEQARATFAEAIEQRESLVKFRPEAADYKSSLANTYMLASDLAIAEGDLVRARTLLDKAVAQAREAVRHAPRKASFHRRLTTALDGNAKLLIKTGDLPAAVDAYREEIHCQRQLTELPDSNLADRVILAEIQQALADSLCAVQRSREALAEYESAASLWQATGGVNGNLRTAECYLNCLSLTHDAADPAVTQRRSQEAIAALRRAVQGGFKDLETLKNDPQFEPLRGQAGYQDLLRECEAAVRGKAK